MRLKMGVEPSEAGDEVSLPPEAREVPAQTLGDLAAALADIQDQLAEIRALARRQTAE